jgi:gluconolactonase
MAGVRLRAAVPGPGALGAAALGAALILPGAPAGAGGPFDGPPDAIVDLASADGLRLVRGEWRFREARLVPVASRSVGTDLRATGVPVRTLDIEPRAGAADFDDSGWEVVPPERLEQRRGTGRFSQVWYRLHVTLPERVGGVDIAGSTVVFEIVADDYAEVWVNGVLPRVLATAGGHYVAGFNAPNRLVVARDARPGQEIRIAVLASNGPLSDPPANFIWIRTATLDIYRPSHTDAMGASEVEVQRADAGLDRVVPRGAMVERLAAGFLFTEGPVWVPDGYLLFSDPNANTIYRWTPGEGAAVFRPKSGYAGADVAEYRQPGSNGLALDAEGRLTIAQHGNRRVIRVEPTGAITVMADRFEGRRLNSPNDLVYRSDGTLYFTDPPFGLPRAFDDPRKELPFSGLYRVKGGRVTLEAKELAGPNGLAFSPDERFLYVGNWDERRKVVMRYPVAADGTLGPGETFFDMTAAPDEDAIDGIKVDTEGRVYVSGPGGLWIISPQGRLLGTLVLPEHPHNLAWGDADGRTLYLTARTGLYRLRVNAVGAGRPGLPAQPSRR